MGHTQNGIMYGIDDLDQVGGWYDDGAGGPIHGLIWQDGISATLDFPTSTRTALHGINDSGVIFGTAQDANGAFFFTATPNAESASPEPVTLSLMGGAFCLLGLLKRRRRAIR